jgi:acetylornithine deacetylase/succinyl-diaminopimelate desuccinylase-like protein
MGGADPGGDAGCVVPDPDQAWTTPFQDDIVSKLSGHADVSAGVRLVNRATAANRQAARQYLDQVFTDMGLVAVEQNYGSGANVYAELQGVAGARQRVVVGAHFDSVPPSPGANDNATGVAVVLATARYLTTVPCRTKHFTFVLFDEEEVGLVGSKNFAAKLKADGASVHSVHTIDQMGWDQNDDRLIELELPDTGLAELYQTAVAELGVSIPIKKTQTGSTDHASFRPAFPATGVTEGYTSGDTTPYYHKPGDTYETVDFAYMKSTTVLVGRVMTDLSR